MSDQDLDTLIDDLRWQAQALTSSIMMSVVRERVEWRAADELERLRDELAEARGKEG